MEIERKFLIRSLPDNLEQYPCHLIEQGYLSVRPVVRVRRDNDDYILTYKGSGMMAREEYNLPLDAQSYEHLLGKCDGNIITKRRYNIPSQTEGLTVELDIFEGVFSGLILAEVEFPSVEAADSYQMEDYFSEDVTTKKEYHNSYLSSKRV